MCVALNLNNSTALFTYNLALSVKLGNIFWLQASFPLKTCMHINNRTDYIDSILWQWISRYSNKCPSSSSYVNNKLWSKSANWSWVHWKPGWGNIVLQRGYYVTFRTLFLWLRILFFLLQITSPEWQEIPTVWTDEPSSLQISPWISTWQPCILCTSSMISFVNSMIPKHPVSS